MIGSGNEVLLDDAQRAQVLSEWRRLAAEPPPFNPRPYGCLTVVAGIALFLLIPQLGIQLPPPWGQVLAAVIGLVVLGGAIAGIFLGSGVRGRAALRAEQALAALTADPAPDPETRLRNAVALLACAVISDGPTTSTTIDLEAARQRLGSRLDEVLAVEAVLSGEVGPLQIFRRS